MHRAILLLTMLRGTGGGVKYNIAKGTRDPRVEFILTY